MEEMWLARDKYNGLFLYIGAAPMRRGGNEFWYFDQLKTTSVQLPDALFPEVQWSDNEPTKVKLEIVK